MPDFIPLDYNKLVPNTFYQPPSAGEFVNYSPVDMGWGKMNMSAFSLPEIGVMKVEATLRENVHLIKRDEGGTTVDTCIFLEGSVASDFPGLGERILMRKGMQNFIYQPDLVADHYVPAQDTLKILHFTIDKFYYTTLLSENEKWAASLKEQILNNELIFGLRTNMQMSPQMFNIVNGILNCPLQGNLRTLVMESKIIEFVALQLDRLVKESSGPALQKIKGADRDALHALRDYLHQTFTKDHSLKSLAMAFGINEFKLKKGFKELFGSTVFDYLHDLKMEYARELLIAEEVFVSEVSGMVGYKNPNHFSTAFKRKFGMNPAQLKN